MKPAVFVLSILVLSFFSTSRAQTTFTSTGNGLWSSMVWSPPGIPGAGDTVVIRDADSVVINLDLNLGGLRIGQGTRGILMFDGAAARAVSMAGDIAVRSGGTMIVQQNGPFANSLTIRGDLTNDGLFDMSRNSASTVCSVAFVGVGDQQVRGSGALTRFRVVSLNKGSTAARVICSTNVTVSGASVFVDTLGTWEQVSDTLRIGSGNQTIGTRGRLVLSGTGSLLDPGASITLNGSLIMNTAGCLVLGSGNNNLTVGAAGALTMTAGTALINGRLTLSGGSTTINGAAVKIDPQGGSSPLAASGNSFECSGSANLSFSSGMIMLVNPDTGGDARTGRDMLLSSSGTINLAGGSFILGAGSGTKKAAGTGFLLAAGGNQLGDLLVQTGGAAGRNVQLKQALGVGGALTLAGGWLDLNGNIVTIGPAGTLSESPGCTIRGTSGAVTVTRTLAAPGGEDIAGLGIAITSAADLGLTTITRGHNPQTGGGNNGICRFFDVSPAHNAALNASIVMKYDHAELNAIPEQNLVFCSSTDNGSTWTVYPGALDTADNTITLNHVDRLCRWTATNNAAPLPIQLVSFTASRCPSGRVRLAWRTLSEVNNYGFELERSSPAPTGFSVISPLIPGHGTTLQSHEYAYADTGRLRGSALYRLKQIDLDGSIRYSGSIRVDAEVDVPGTEFALLQNFPNPFNPATTIEYTIGVVAALSGALLSGVEEPAPMSVRLVVYDILGREVAVLVNGRQSPGVYEMKFDGSSLASGVYFCRLTVGQIAQCQKMVLAR